ncbi:MAG: cupin domain-containing protein [Atribacterota bacterium]
MLLQELCKIGSRIKQERLKYGLTLEEVAKATGLSAGFLSLLENGKINPSVKSLVRLCSFFSIHLASLFEEESNDQVVFLFPKEKQIEINLDKNQTIRFLFPKKSFIEPVLVTLQPHFVTQDFTTHKGIEFGYVIEGTIEVHIKDYGVIKCHEGDSIIYSSETPHKLQNSTDKVAIGLWIGLPFANSGTSEILMKGVKNA